MFDRIITHNDFDGIASAAICLSVYEIDTVFFTGPSQITENRLPIGNGDIVCDLPYPISCGMWFDHHEGNLNDVKLRGIDPQTIPGAFAPEKNRSGIAFAGFLSTERRTHSYPEAFLSLIVLVWALPPISETVSLPDCW